MLSYLKMFNCFENVLIIILESVLKITLDWVPKRQCKEFRKSLFLSLSLSLSHSKIRTRRDPASTLQNRQAPLSLLAKPLDRPPRSVWVPMQNEHARLSLLAKPLHRPLPQKPVFWLCIIPSM